MGFLRKALALPLTAAVEAEAPSLAGTPYVGDKRPIFRDGFFYLCDTDPDGNELGPDTTVPLIWKNESFHYALPEDVNHFHAHGLNEVELEPGAE